MPHFTGIQAGGVTFGPRSFHTPDLLIGSTPPGDPDAGGVVGGIVRVIGDLIGGRIPGLPQLPPTPGGTLPQLPSIQNGPFTLGGPIPPTNGCPTAACCSGQHLNKTRGCDGLPPGSKCVSNRRMNALNPQALRRAIRRAKGFERFVKANRKSLRSLARI